MTTVTTVTDIETPTLASLAPTILMAPLLRMIPEGMYVGQLDDEARPVFFRVETVGNRRRWPKGTLLFKQAHGSPGGYTYHEVAAVAPQDPAGLGVAARPFYGREVIPLDLGVVNELAVVMCDWHAATKRYGELAQRCCRCDAELTDPVSLHYTLGSYCIEQWDWLVQEINEERGVFVAPS